MLESREPKENPLRFLSLSSIELVWWRGPPSSPSLDSKLAFRSLLIISRSYAMPHDGYMPVPVFSIPSIPTRLVILIDNPFRT
jgi:hypothetical protein